MEANLKPSIGKKPLIKVLKTNKKSVKQTN